MGIIRDRSRLTGRGIEQEWSRSEHGTSPHVQKPAILRVNTRRKFISGQKKAEKEEIFEKVAYKIRRNFHDKTMIYLKKCEIDAAI